MKKFLQLLLLVTSINQSFLYGQTARPEFVPPSPNAYSLGKYVDVPISLNTGIPNVEIPIWSIKEGSLSADISLSYHASGIKVDEIASWVGLGWSLNAGGTIVRKVRGLPEGLLKSGVMTPERANFDFYNSSKYASRQDYIQENGLEAALNKGLDTEPDEYYFNFGGRTGKFHLDKSGNAVLYEKDDYRIQLKYSSQSPDFDIIITTEDGTIYEFMDHEKTYYQEQGRMRTSAWYLTKIKSLMGNEIIFENQGVGRSNHDIREYSEYMVKLTSNPSIYPSPTPITDVSVIEMRINKIIWANGWVEFIAGKKERLDYENYFYPLESVIVYKSDGSILKKIKLKTSYFEANNTNKFDGTSPEAYKHLNYRLRLDEVQELSADEFPMAPPYRLIYQGDNDPTTNDIYTLPYRLSPKQDHWGFFNNSYNTHIFPGNNGGKVISADPIYEMFEMCGNLIKKSIGNGADREPNAEAVKAGLLKEIHYPTGGHIEFYFEPHTFFGGAIGGGVRVKKIINHPSTNEVTTETNYTYQDMSTDEIPTDYYYRSYCLHNDPSISVKNLRAYLGLPTENTSGNKEDYIKISSYPQAILGNGSKPDYREVTVSQPGNGYTVNEFAGYFEYPDYKSGEDIYDDIDFHHLDGLFYTQYITSYSGSGFLENFDFQLQTSIYDLPYPETYDNSWKRSKLKSQSTYNENSVLVEKKVHRYKRELFDVLAGFKIIGWGIEEYENVSYSEFGEFIFNKYYVPHASIKLDKTEITQYDQNGKNPVVSVIEYYYDNPIHSQITRTETITSDGETLVTKTFYPDDVTGTSVLEGGSLSGEEYNAISQLKRDTQHRIALPIQQETWKNGVKLSTQRTTYRTWDYHGNLIFPELVKTAHGNASLENRIRYHGYNGGNPTMVSKEGGAIISYLWGYNKQYPIAKFENVSYEDIAYALGVETSELYYYDEYDLQEINSLRNSGFPNALITTYTYDPLVGLTSMTDPNGITTYYEYDGFGRLQSIRDHENNILKEYEYNYKDPED